ncbi:MAG: ABC transporter permease [Acidimicrobiales bacterium]
MTETDPGLEAAPVVDVNEDEEDFREGSLAGDAWRELRRRPLFWFCVSIILVLVVAAIVPQLFTSKDPLLGDQRNNLQGPSSEHWFGTDLQGRDQYARVVYGARVSIVVAFFVTLAAALVALTFGSLAGFYGGGLDGVISRITDVWFAIPGVLGGIVMLQLFERRSIFTLCLVLIVFGWPTMLRLVRSSVIAVKNADYVDAARALGASDRRIIAQHILPNALTPLVVFMAITFGVVIAAEAALTFIGVGLRKPAVSWGLIISDSRGRIQTHAYLLLLPGLVLSMAVFSFILLGDLLRDAFDPRQR